MSWPVQYGYPKNTLKPRARLSINRSIATTPSLPPYSSGFVHPSIQSCPVLYRLFSAVPFPFSPSDRSSRHPRPDGCPKGGPLLQSICPHFISGKPSCFSWARPRPWRYGPKEKGCARLSLPNGPNVPNCAREVDWVLVQKLG